MDPTSALERAFDHVRAAVVGVHGHALALDAEAHQSGRPALVARLADAVARLTGWTVDFVAASDARHGRHVDSDWFAARVRGPAGWQSDAAGRYLTTRDRHAAAPAPDDDDAAAAEGLRPPAPARQVRRGLGNGW
jgi:hypothetical protein